MNLDEKEAIRARRVRPRGGVVSHAPPVVVTVPAPDPAQAERVAALEAALAVAGQAVTASTTELIDLRQRFDAIEGAMRALAAEAERKLRSA